jgi:hypothetical protein
MSIPPQAPTWFQNPRTPVGLRRSPLRTSAHRDDFSPHRIPLQEDPRLGWIPRVGVPSRIPPTPAASFPKMAEKRIICHSIPGTSTFRSAGGLSASFFPAAAGGPLGPGIFHVPGDREDFFDVRPSAMLAEEGILPRSDSFPDLGNGPAGPAAIFIDRHFYLPGMNPLQGVHSSPGRGTDTPWADVRPVR